jgi:hypothetical protein
MDRVEVESLGDDSLQKLHGVHRIWFGRTWRATFEF